jgi:hypothetical protein
LQLVRLTLTRDDPTILRVPVTPSAADFAESNLPLRAEPLPSRNATASQDVNPSPHRLLPWIVYGAAALTVVAAIGFWMISSSGWLESGAKGGPPKGAEVLTKDDGSGLKPPPTPPTVQSLRVDSKPQDARISVGGVATGQSTPAEIKVAAGDSIRLEKRGFETREAVISPSDLQSQSVLYELRQAEGPRLEVQITGSYPFEVYDGPKKLFDADTAHKLQAREGQILTLKSDRYFLNRPVRVEARGGRALPIVAPETGDIVFVGNESCVVFVDGKRADYVMRQLTVAAGEHRFEFRCSDQARVPPITLKIAPGDNPARSVR